jgi:hypothetical protein
VTKMHKIKGVAVGVFDGHGGSLCVIMGLYRRIIWLGIFQFI